MVRHRSGPPRHPAFDYGADGWYFVTTCTAGRRPLFARVDGGRLRLTPVGEIVAEVWQRTPKVDPHVTLDRYVVMPDHVHGIVVLDGVNATREGSRTLSTIVGTFKSAASRAIRKEILIVGPIWQRSYHDRIIRSSGELSRIRWYIEMNPSRWVADHG